jgi:hypothetical protein
MLSAQGWNKFDFEVTDVLYVLLYKLTWKKDNIVLSKISNYKQIIKTTN